MTAHYDVTTGDVREWCIAYKAQIDRGEAEPFHRIFGDPPYMLEFMGSGKRDAPHRIYMESHKAEVESLAGLLGLKPWEAAAVLWWRDYGQAMRAICYPGARLALFGGTRTYDLMVLGLRAAGWLVQDCLMYLYGGAMPHAHNIGKAIDKEQGNARPVLRERKHTPKFARVVEHGYRPTENGYNSRERSTFVETAPGSVDSEQWETHRHALKPTFEPLALAMNPLPPGCTYADAALQWGTVGYNIDGARIGSGESRRYPGNTVFEHHADCVLQGERVEDWDCHPDCPVAELDRQSGVSRSRASGYDWSAGDNDNPSRAWARNIKSGQHYDDVGGASRFFYTSKAAPWERDAFLDNMPDLLLHRVNPGGLEHEDRFAPVPAKNPHPTLKSIKTMEYICRLLMPPTHVASRWFVMCSGSGSEMIAAALAGAAFVQGVELDQDSEYPGIYVPIARARLAAWLRYDSYRAAEKAHRESQAAITETIQARRRHDTTLERGQLTFFGDDV